MVLLRLLSLARWSRSKGYHAAVLGATVFLIHPLATESVSLHHRPLGVPGGSVHAVGVRRFSLAGIPNPYRGDDPSLSSFFCVAAATKEGALSSTALVAAGGHLFLSVVLGTIICAAYFRPPCDH
jgi:hypothetical protein